MQEIKARTREYELSTEDFDRIRTLVREHTGMALAESKRELVYSRLVRRLRALRLAGFGEYITLLEQGDWAEIEEFTNSVTTNLTSFYREAHHFDFLRDVAFPEIAARNAATRRLRVWSAACSTGEEPYSLAITLQESMSLFRGWDNRILATDLDSQVLAHSIAGEYRLDRFDKVSAERRRDWFEETRPGFLTARRDLKSLITFRQLNLMQPWPFKGPFDVIFCRNVVIYFDKATQRMLFEKISNYQRPGDYLCIGHSESLFKVCDKYELVGKTIYRRLG
jgi:chemotaxis protein methyltransferase CheR